MFEIIKHASVIWLIIFGGFTTMIALILLWNWFVETLKRKLINHTKWADVISIAVAIYVMCLFSAVILYFIE